MINLVFLINDQRYSHTCRICMYGYFAYNCMNDLLVNILILGYNAKFSGIKNINFIDILIPHTQIALKLKLCQNINIIRLNFLYSVEILLRYPESIKVLSVSQYCVVLNF